MTLSQPIPKGRGSLAGSSWRLANNLGLRLLPTLLGIIIFLIPTQLGIHFWLPSTIIYGIKIDYLSPVLYFLDLIIILYLVLKIFTSSLKVPSSTSPLILVLLFNLIYSINPLSSLNWNLHFLLYFFFINNLSSQTYSQILIKPIFFSMIFQTLLSAIQVSLGHSLGGWFYYLGERTISVGQPAIAQTELLGQTTLRSYGTFSHPNTLAGWLVISTLILLTLIKNQKPNLKTSKIIFLSLIFTIIGIALAHSRAAALSLFIFIIPIYFFSSHLPRIIYFMAIILILFRSNLSILLSGSSLSLLERLDLQTLSIQIFSHYPLFGTGTSSSLSAYPLISPHFRLFQPDHNSFTLLLSWFGLFGLSSIIIWLRQKQSLFKVFILRIAPLLPIILLDHYLLTSSQGLIIIMFYLSLAFNPHFSF